VKTGEADKLQATVLKRFGPIHRWSGHLSLPIKAGLLVFLMSFGFYAATTQQLVGYEPETGAITEGLVLEGHFWDVDNAAIPSLEAGFPGRGGHLYGRTGLLQPLLEAPFYAAGHFIDGHFGWAEPNPYRLVFLWFYNPFVAALAAVAMFALVYLTRKSVGWAAAIAALFVFASLAWPYAKIGMETTFMFAVLAAFAFAAWARDRPTVAAWSATGFAAGAVAATKPYGAISFLPLAIMLWPIWSGLDRRRQLRLGLAAVLPVLAWLVAIGWYNWVRFGSLTDFGYPESSLTLSMPLNALGMLFSPGKGLILYSPLVILGVLGLPRLWRADRWLTVALLVLFAALTCLSGASTYWGDEVWGPRYLVPAAWTLLVPIAWWADTSTRRRALAGLTVVAFAIQLVGASAYYGQYASVVNRLTGVPIYAERAGVDPEQIPYGDDPTRWIPQLSPLLLQTEGLISTQILEPLGGNGLYATYDPFEGRSRTVNLSDTGVRLELDYYWHSVFPTLGARVFAALMLVLSLLSGFGLYRLASRRRISRPGPPSHPVRAGSY
jgi:hypothetical protein